MAYQPFPPVNAAPGSAIPTQGLLLGGSDGTDLRAVLVDTAGRPLIQQPNNVLLATANQSLTTTTTSTSETASATGRCVVVTVENIDTSQMAHTCSVRVRDTTNGIVTGWQTVGMLFNGEYGTLYFNLPVTNGDTVVIDTVASGTLTASKTAVTAVLSPLEIATQLTPNGRGLPVGSNVISSVFNSAANLVAAPASGFRIMLKELLVAGATTSADAFPSATVNGNASTYINGCVGESFSFFQGALLCDPATAIANGWSGGTVVCSGLYDIVPT